MADASRGDRYSIGNIINSIGVAIGNGAKAIVNIFPGQAEAQDANNRRIVLDRVHHAWIKGVLERSIYKAVLIELDKQMQPDAVAQPWHTEVQEMTGESQPVAAGTRLLEVFNSHEQALLILGAPGAGKTITLLELARDALASAEDDPVQPIPVVFNLSSWGRTQNTRGLFAWLTKELIDKYKVSRRVGEAWLVQDKLLLLLDGLDEVVADRREACVQAINEFRQEHGLTGIVVCSRLQEYEALGALGHQLALGGAVVLHPLTTAQIDEHLAGLGAEVDHIRDALRQDATLRDMARTPLFLSVLLMAYLDTPTVALAPGPTDEERRRHLFATYVQRMLRRRGKDARCSPERTIHWLACLATALKGETVFRLEHLQPDWLPTRALRWQYVLLDRLGLGVAIGLVGWLISGPYLGLVGGLVGGLFGGQSNDHLAGQSKFRRLITDAVWGALVVGLVFGLVVGLASGLASGLGSGLVGGLGSGLVGGLVGGVAGAITGRPSVRPRRIIVVETLRWSPAKALRSAQGALVGGLVFGLVVGLVGGLVVGLVEWLVGGLSGGLIEGLFQGLLQGLVVGLAGGLVVGLAGGLVGGLVGGVVEEKETPEQAIRRSMWIALVSGLVGGLFGGLIFGFFGWLIFALDGGLIEALVGALVGGLFGCLIVGLSSGLAFGGYAVFSHYALRLILWRHGFTPLNYVRFLDYCVDRIFLQRVGGGYIFVHRLLMEYFASLYVGSSTNIKGTRDDTIAGLVAHTLPQHSRISVGRGPLMCGSTPVPICHPPRTVR